MNASTEIAELERALIWATNPQKLLKFGNAGNPKFREFSLSGDLKSLVWNSKSKREKTQSRVVIDSIREIVFGQRTEKFLRHRRVDLEHLSFSLVFETTAPSGAKLIDSLDVIAKDEKEFRKWTAVLIALTGKRVPNDVMARVQDVVRAMRPDQCDEIGNESRIENEKSFFPYPLKKSIANSPFIKRIPARVTITNKFKDKPQLSDESRDFQSAFHHPSDLFIVGNGEWGQTGQADLKNLHIPTIVPSLLGKGVQTLSVGSSHMVIAIETGEITVFGNRLGTGLPKDTNTPVDITLESKHQIITISSGNYHNAILTEFGQLYTWGCDIFGQLGHGDFRDELNPRQVRELSANQIIFVSCGSNFTCAVSSLGELFTWGSGAHGCLGLGNSEDRAFPTMVETFRGNKVFSVACGEHHTIASAESGAYSWGWNGSGQLGIGSQEDHHSPQLIQALEGATIQQIACGSAHSIAIINIEGRNRQTVYAWGNNSLGQLGISDAQTIVNKPTVVKTIDNENIIEVSCGSFHTLALAESGVVYSAGLNNCGQLARNPEKMSCFEFERVEHLKEKKVRQIICGSYNSCFLVARAWFADKETLSCLSCREKFTFVNRRHHCRNCGGIYCGACSSKKSAILKYGITKPVRVCNTCHDILAR